MNKILIYDYETLGVTPWQAPVISLALLEVHLETMTTVGYSYAELVDQSVSYKFNVEEQVKKYNRRIEKHTIEWCSQQNKEVRRIIAPSPTDISISKLYNILMDEWNIASYDMILVRGVGFDSVFTASLLQDCGFNDPVSYWKVRDLRSFIDGLTWDKLDPTISNRFIPKEVEDQFVPHDPCHDVAMDAYRIQYLLQLNK
jgi:hypothetical protein